MIRHFNESTLTKTRRIIGQHVKCRKALAKLSTQETKDTNPASHLRTHSSFDRQTPSTAAQKRNLMVSEDSDTPQRKKGNNGPPHSVKEQTTNKLAPQKKKLEGLDSGRLKSAGHDEPTEPNSFSDDISLPDDVLNEKFTAEEEIRYISKAKDILRKYKNTQHKLSHPKSKKSWLVHTISNIIRQSDRNINPHKFQFTNTRDAAKFNTRILKRYKYDLVAAMKNEKGTMLEPGSEFRLVKTLEPLLKHHNNWQKFKKIITEGVDYNLEHLPEGTRRSDLLAQIERGDHKSASEPENEPTLLKNYDKEVSYGWMIPVTKECTTKLKGAGVIPIRVATQYTIDEEGNRSIKRRTIHDASFPPPSRKSINARLDKDTLEPCYYGFCLLRLLHLIHMMRHTNPTIAILIMKIDLDSAYRRLHVLVRMALLAITIIKRIAYILMRLPFGVANGPGDYGIISETIFDLTNDLLQDETWDPETTKSPLATNIDKPKTNHTNDTPFGSARKLYVPVPAIKAGTDGYIDDIVTVMLDIDDWVQRGVNAALLAVFTIFRPHTTTDPLPRSDATSIRKLKGEGTPDEKKIVLGWQINTRKFKIYLPKLKSIDWINEIRKVIHANKVTTSTLESLIGKLNHVGYIIPQGRYFLNRLRHLLARTKSFGAQSIDTDSKEDLKLWILLLTRASKQGVNINNITFSDPTNIAISDACEHGIGGYNDDGLAWRYEIPLKHRGKLSINLLEFIASVVTIELTLREKGENQKILALTDSSSALGWLHKASFPNSMSIHNTVARKLASNLIRRDSSLYAQHIKGSHNFIADSLSRDHHIPSNHLISAFHRILPQQTPPNLQITPLPTDITSWLLSLMHSATNKQGSPSHLTRSKLGVLINGDDFWQQWGSVTNGSTATTSNNRHTFSAHLLQLADEINAVKQTRDYLLATPSRPPLHMFARPSGRTFGVTPPSMRMIDPRSS